MQDKNVNVEVKEEEQLIADYASYMATLRKLAENVNKMIA